MIWWLRDGQRQLDHVQGNTVKWWREPRKPDWRCLFERVKNGKWSLLVQGTICSSVQGQHIGHLPPLTAFPQDALTFTCLILVSLLASQSLRMKTLEFFWFNKYVLNPFYVQLYRLQKIKSLTLTSMWNKFRCILLQMWGSFEILVLYFQGFVLFVCSA